MSLIAARCPFAAAWGPRRPRVHSPFAESARLAGRARLPARLRRRQLVGWGWSGRPGWRSSRGRRTGRVGARRHRAGRGWLGADLGRRRNGRAICRRCRVRRARRLPGRGRLLSLRRGARRERRPAVRRELVQRDEVRGARVRPERADVRGPPLLSRARLRPNPGHLRSAAPNLRSRLDAQRSGHVLGTVHACRRVRVRCGLCPVRRGAAGLRAHVDRAGRPPRVRADPGRVWRGRRHPDVRVHGGCRLWRNPVLRGERRDLLRHAVTPGSARPQTTSRYRSPLPTPTGA